MFDSEALDLKSYVVGFVDILSQKDALRKLRDIPPDGVNDEEFRQVLSDTFGVLRAFRSWFQIFRDAGAGEGEFSTLNSEQRAVIDSLPEDDRNELVRMKRDAVIIRPMSDAVVLATSLADEAPIPLNGIFYMLEAVSKLA